MTKVYLEQNGNQYTVECRGHATGSVETCAAVSCLVYTLTGWLRNTDAALTLNVSLEDGEAHIQFCGGTSAETVFDMIAVGFLQMQEQYGDYISVEFSLIEKN